MPKLNLPEPRAFTAVGIVSKKGSQLVLAFGMDRVLFVKDIPVAVKSGGVVYQADVATPGSTTLAINQLASEGEHIVRVAAPQYDFILGSTLTRMGLLLTRKADND